MKFRSIVNDVSQRFLVSMAGRCTALVLSMWLAACSTGGDGSMQRPASGALRDQASKGINEPFDTGTEVSGTLPRPRILQSSRALQCVPYARAHSSFNIRGDAWTWWERAAEDHRRDHRPAIGSILVLKKTERLQFGHLAVVSRLINERRILVDHANWLNRGQIHQNIPVEDVSAANDWSLVRVWYVPGNTLGLGRYPAHGFIHPNHQRRLELRRPFMRGPDVRLLQEALLEKGYNLVPDSIFGKETETALSRYQASMNLPANGVASEATLKSLKLGYRPPQAGSMVNAKN